MVSKWTHEKIHWLALGSDFSIIEYSNKWIPKKLAHGLIFTVMTYQGYDINEYTFYIEQQDKKSTYQNSDVCVDAYDVTNQDKNMYYGQI
jgi:hypothetical protein